MSEWTFRVLGEPLSLAPDEQCEVAAEIARLRTLISGGSGSRRVRLGQNPAGLLGEYTSLLMEATVRGRADEDVLPADVRVRYGKRSWFAASLEILIAFSEQWDAVRTEQGD